MLFWAQVLEKRGFCQLQLPPPPDPLCLQNQEWQRVELERKKVRGAHSHFETLRHHKIDHPSRKPWPSAFKQRRFWGWLSHSAHGDSDSMPRRVTPSDTKLQEVCLLAYLSGEGWENVLGMSSKDDILENGSPDATNWMPLFKWITWKHSTLGRQLKVMVRFKEILF